MKLRKLVVAATVMVAMVSATAWSCDDKPPQAGEAFTQQAVDLYKSVETGAQLVKEHFTPVLHEARNMAPGLPVEMNIEVVRWVQCGALALKDCQSADIQPTAEKPWVYTAARYGPESDKPDLKIAGLVFGVPGQTQVTSCKVDGSLADLYALWSEVKAKATAPASGRECFTRG